MPDTTPTQAIARLFSWMRQGLHAGMTTASSGMTTQDGHLAVPIRLRVNSSNAIDVPVRLYGPGDVVGIDQREVIRTEPHRFSTDFEPNYFPLIECDRPDFPWLFTPAAADAAGHLQPWLCLVVVRKDGSSITTNPTQPLPVLICPQQELPNLTEAWAWAHAQIVECSTRIMDPALNEKAQKERVQEFLKKSPERTVSRLLCPRRLDPNTAYHACLVPTFDVGRKAGLGESVTVEDERGMRPAWASGSGASGNDPVKLPVYYSWEFSTGVGGDFEALARRLEPRILPATVGLRSMHIGAPGWGMPTLSTNASGSVLGLEGALRTPDTEPTAWPNEARIAFQTALRNILNAPAEQAPPGSEIGLVGPPLYGQWYAKQRVVPAGSNPPQWFRELNMDPRSRVAAGLGTQVIRFEQEQLMASAWEQLARHEQDNQRLKRAQLSEAVGQVLSKKHFEPLPFSRFLQMTAPIHHQVRANDTRSLQTLMSSGSPLVSAAFRRVTRSRRPVARRLPMAMEPTVSERGGPATSGHQRDRGLRQIASLAAAFGTPSERQASHLDSTSATLLASNEEHPIRTAIARLQTVKERVLHELDSRVTVLSAVQRDIPNAESTDLIRFAPEFPQPMYEPLRDYFQDQLLPGMELVPPNTITLLETNPRFIEAYMVGLNHEMGRELLWRGFPTDQRGTYFRQFWDIQGRVPVPKPEEREGLKDITPITAWAETAHLGEQAGKGSTEGQMVLLVRGDLLRRYPRAIVYAVEAVWSANGTRRELGTEERYPMFRATRAPDVTMLGFSLTDTQVRGADSQANGHAGWFFVLQQQPTEARFGLDVATTFGSEAEHWSDLSWGHVAADEQTLKQLVHVPLDGLLRGKTLDNVPWGKNSAHMASITRQRPFRVAVHARTWLKDS